MAKLFGFKIEKDDDQNKNVVSPVPQNKEDSSDYYVSSGFYGQYVDIDGVYKSEFELIKRYREMALHPEVDSAIEDIINEAIVSDQNDSPVEIDLENLPASAKLKDLIREEFKKVKEVIGFDNLNNSSVVNFKLDSFGAKKFAYATKNNIGKRLAIIIDDKVVSAPVVRDAITTGNGQISGSFSVEEANNLSIILRSGALPAPMSIIEERTVGPDLGQESIDKGVFSLIIGFILVILYIFYNYKIFGIFANISLFINLILLISILTIVEATLTLPGIAGIILTVGMAVDANVLIYERIKEELKIEDNILIAFDSGYKRVLTTLLDANITTLIAAFVLYFVGSGPIKGFAVTLAIGIITSLFTTFILGRLFVSVYIKSKKGKEIKI